MAFWSDLYKIYSYAFEDDPISQAKAQKDITGAGVGQPDAIPDIRQDGSFWGGGGKGLIRLRESNDFIDLSSITNRISRYKEYDRLLNVGEINSALTVIADETCIAGDTLIATPFYGLVTIEWLTKNKANERFLVYCWDFKKNDYTLGWAFNPRVVKKAATIKVKLDNGKQFIVTPDHRILNKDKQWVYAQNLQYGDELSPFYRLPANENLNSLKNKQFARVFTNENGWMSERQFIDEWKNDIKVKKDERLLKVMRMITEGLNTYQIARALKTERTTIAYWLKREGFTHQELSWLGRKKKHRKVLSVTEHKEMDVYDLSVEEHLCFCTDSVIMHNCQPGENNHVFEVTVKNEEVKKELELLFFHRKLLNVDRNIWSWCKSLCAKGDLFLELIINPEDPKSGIFRAMELPPESIFRIETTKGKLLEFQQSKEGPDIQAITRSDVAKSTKAEIDQTTAIRFTPEQIVHFRLFENKKNFYPYGVSLIEPARGPAHQLKLMEDAMMVYRLTRAAERRVFYIDVGQMPSHKAESFVDRMKDLYRKRKVPSNRGTNAEGVEERTASIPVDEDIWIPTRPNSQTRIDTLPGACLALDTQIPLLDGRTLTLQEIINEFNATQEILWTYSCHPTTGKFAPGKITWAGVTRKNTQVYKLFLSNGEAVICTPDHKFPVLGKGFVECQELTIEDKLVPYKSTKDIRIVNIKFLEEVQDTGTLTIDGNEELHNYHTFALAAGVYTKNSNLGEIDDALFFRDKLYRALNFPKNYFSSEDPNATRITLSAQDVKFARFIQRIQSHLMDGFHETAERHLILKGFPRETFDDLMLIPTPPSNWQELSKAEVISNRINNATTLKSSMLMGDFDVLTKWMKYSEEEAEEIIARNKLQQMEQMKLQILASNPQLLGIGAPSEGETEIGADMGGPNPMVGNPEEQPPPEGQEMTGEQPEMPPDEEQPQSKGIPLPEPSKEDIMKYDLEIQNYESEQDQEEVDFSLGD